MNKFESKWFEWDYNDIVFWFKVKLGYFNEKNNHKEKDNNEIDKNVMSINFENVICKNLKSQQIRSKYLAVLNPGD